MYVEGARSRRRSPVYLSGTEFVGYSRDLRVCVSPLLFADVVGVPCAVVSSAWAVSPSGCGRLGSSCEFSPRGS